jgi:hypothetical protein
MFSSYMERKTIKWRNYKDVFPLIKVIQHAADQLIQDDPFSVAMKMYRGPRKVVSKLTNPGSQAKSVK